MFRQARLKLTAWYLIIIMLVSLAFSVVIYRAATFELKRFSVAQQNRFALRMAPPILIDSELIAEATARIRRALILINLGILSISAVLGYYLSGKTLSPIQEMMEEQNRFVSDASHELKTPLTAIKSTLEVALRDKDLNLPTAIHTIESGLEEVNRLQKLTEGLLQLSHQKTDVEMTKVDIASLVKEAVAMMEPITKSKQIKLLVKSKKVLVEVDRMDILGAIVGVVDNAIKYSRVKGKIEISTLVEARMVAIKIRDYGKGIAPADLPRVFTRFYRSDRARATQGYGLGLSIAKQSIERNLGKIEIESKIDKGTLVTIRLPYSASIQ